jgi:hypothetical protein
MSDTDGMVRLMEHAADKLRTDVAPLARLQTLNTTEQAAVNAALISMTYAQAILRMVAASVAPEGATLIGRLLDRLTTDYHGWAEKFTQTEMSDGELTTIERFLRWATAENG